LKLRENLSQLKIARVEVGAERHDRKVIAAILDSPEYPAPVAIEIDVRPNEPIKLHVGELIP
jgi:hypothetical protein